MCILHCVRRITQLDKKIEELNFQLHAARLEIRKYEVADDTWRKYECKLCMEHTIEKVFLPCGHALSCNRCAQKIGNFCPVCETRIETQTPLYMM